MITNPVAVAGSLMALLGALFWANRQPKLAPLFKVVPLMVFAYFVPTLLSNTGVLPLENGAYVFIKKCSYRRAFCF